ncbi:MAG: hypothetical protein HDQ87_03040 [Clostridia bacterium]|nr:hypothetical protein [Clostridia bacterium]
MTHVKVICGGRSDGSAADRAAAEYDRQPAEKNKAKTPSLRPLRPQWFDVWNEEPECEPDAEAEDCCSFSSVRNLLTTSLCDRERNAAFLRGKPWRPLGSWALFYALGFDLQGSRYVLVPVSDAMMRDWDVDADQLHQEAVANARLLSPAWLERADSGPREKEIPRCNLLEAGLPGGTAAGPFRLSNRSGTNGASVIGWEGILEKTSEVLGGDFVIVPFSVHEVLVLPAADEELDLNVWRSGLHLFNASPQVMPPEDVLSDNLQLYEQATGLLRAV